jgi:DNA polymerase III subunit beta
MRFTIDREQFLKGLNIAGHAISNKSANPILLNLKLELTQRGLEITGSDGDVSIWTMVPAVMGDKEIIHGGAYGAALLSCHYLTMIISKCEGAEISLEIIDGAQAKIDDDKSSFKLNCIDAEEYPTIDFEKPGTPFTLPAKDLIAVVEQTAFAALVKDTRPILQAINLKAEAGKMTATATDSARLSRKTITVDESLRFNCNVPARTLSDLTHLFDPMENVEISASGEKIIFGFGYTLVSSRLISGDYPVSSAIIPTTFNYFLEINSQEFLKAIDRVSILAVDHAPVVKLTMKDDAVEVSSSSDQTGSGIEKLQTTQYTGERLEIAFNSQFVSEAVRALGCEDVSISFQGEMKPFVIKNPKDDSVVELLTPMRTR